MLSTTNFGEEKEVQVREEEKCHGFVLKENPSIRNPSFRYYSVKAGAVPFLWEIQPGTPKHPNSGTIPYLIPPLTPPPSYLHCNNNKKKSNPPTKAGLFARFLPRLKLKRRIKSSPSTPTSSSSVSSSSSSTLSSMTSTYRRRRSRLSWGSSASLLSSGGGDEDYSNGVDHDSPKSVLCFGMKNINMEFLKKCVVSKAIAVQGSTA